MERMFNIATDINSDRFVAERKRYVQQYLEAKMLDRFKKVSAVDMSEDNLVFIENYVADEGFTCADDARDFLSKYYVDKNFNKLRKKLDQIKYKEFDGYGHLSDLEVALMNDIYFKKQMWMEYANVSSLIMFKYMTKKQLAKHYDMSPSALYEMCLVDYILRIYINEGTALNVREVEKSLIYKAIVEKDIQAIKFALTNVYKDVWRDMRHAEATVTTKSALDEELGEMSVEELERLLAEAEEDAE